MMKKGTENRTQLSIWETGEPQPKLILVKSGKPKKEAKVISLQERNEIATKYQENQEQEQDRINKTGPFEEEKQGLKNLIKGIKTGTTGTQYSTSYKDNIKIPSNQPIQRSDFDTLKRIEELRDRGLSIAQLYPILQKEKRTISQIQFIGFFYENLKFNRFGGLELINPTYYQEDIHELPETIELTQWGEFELTSYPNKKDIEIFKIIDELREQGKQPIEIVKHLKTEELKLSNQNLLFEYYHEIKFNEKTGEYKKLTCKTE